MRGAWVLILQALAALLVGLLVAWEVHHQVVVSGEVSEEGALLDVFQGGLSLAVERVSALPYDERAAAAAALSTHFGCPVRLGESEGMLPRVDFDDEPVFTVALRDDDRALIIGPIPDPARLDTADRHGVALLAVVLVMLVTAAVLVVPIARRLHRIEQTIDALAEGQHSARVALPGTDPIARVAARLDVLAAENERLLAAERSLLQAVAHELRAPCQRLRFRLEAVRDGEEGAADAMDRDLDELDALAGELLVFLRYGQRTVERAVLSPLPALERLADDLRVLHPDITVSLPDTAPDVFAEARGLDRVMLNLLSNAARHAAGAVSVSITESSDGVLIAVEDDGPGIPEAERERIFEPFSRVDTSRSRHSGGAGLGLAIAHRILGAHGGSIAAEAGRVGARLETVWPHREQR